MTDAILRDKMLVIQNLHESDEVKKNLIEKGYNSSVKIYQKSEAKFVADVEDILSLDEAKLVYETATRNYMVLTHLTMAWDETYGSPLYRSLRSRMTGIDENKLFENIPSYQEIFGNLDYCDCPHCKSIFGPAAYFVDLMRIISKHIEIDSGGAISLRDRREDLFNKLSLTCENTNNEKPYLEIVNGIIENHVKDYMKCKDLYEELSRTYYPAALPFNLPMAKLRVWLQKYGTSYEEILRKWKFPLETVATGSMGIDSALFALLQKSLTEDMLSRFYGVEQIDLEKIADVSEFLRLTQLKQQDLHNIFVQDIGEGETEKERRHNLFINQGLSDKNGYLAIKEDRIVNLTLDTLERFARFVRLTNIFGVSYDEMDWLLKAADTDASGNISLTAVWSIIDFSRRISLDIYTTTALMGRIKDYGNDFFSAVFGRKRSELEVISNPADLERLLARELNADIDGLRSLRKYLGQKDAVDVDEIYRHCKVAGFLKLRLEEYIILLRLVFTETVRIFSPKQLDELFRVRLDSMFSVYELDYIINTVNSPYIYADFTIDSFHQKIQFMRDSVTAECLADDAMLADYVYAELGDFFGHTSVDIQTLFACFMNEAELTSWPHDVVNSDISVEKLDLWVIILSKYLMLIQSGIGIELISEAVHSKSGFGVSDPKNLTLQSLLDLGRFQQYFGFFQDVDKKLLTFITEYAVDCKNIGTLAEVAGWNKEQVAYVADTLYPGDKREENVTVFIRELMECLYLVKKLAFDESALNKLLIIARDEQEQYDVIRKTVDELCTPFMDREIEAALAAEKRDALLPITLLQLRKTYSDITDYNKLYKYFLIDVEMDDKTRISPIKEGINALQLYLQRCRMRLEKGIKDVTIPKSWWSWIMDYRMWEANRKIFVYPENYLLPSIRQSKTSLFKEMEDALQQSKITDGYIEEQYVKYLDNYFQLTQLKICGAYETVIDNINVLYVFARTQQQPYTYYYCKRVSTLAWSEWEKIDTNIDTDIITPVFVFNRLHIFWSQIQENTKVKVESGDKLNAGNQKAHNLQIKYTYLNLQGEWITPQKLSQDVIIYAEDDQKSSEEMRSQADAFGIDMEDNSFRKLTLLRLTHKNLEGFIDKGEDYECLAVITGSFTQNLGGIVEKFKMNPTLDQEQAAFSSALNQFIENNNYEVRNYEEGYFSTGYFKIFNEDLEEEHLLHKKEFIVVDGYVPPNNAFLYTALHDEIHKAVGVYLSQDVLRDAARPTKGILPHACNSSVLGPRLNVSSFICSDSSGEMIITEELSQKVFIKLSKEDIIHSKLCDSGKMLTDEELKKLLDDLLTDKIDNSIRFIRKVLREHATDSLNPDSFVLKDEPTIGPKLSCKIFEKLVNAGVVLTYVDEKVMASRDLQNVLNDLLVDSELDTRKNNQILEIQSVLLKNLGAVYLFTNAYKAEVIPVTNQPGKFIYDCGDEAFLVYLVYDDEGKYQPVHIQKTDIGVTIGVPVTANTFVKLGFDPQQSRQILQRLKSTQLINKNGIFDMENCSREKLEMVLEKTIIGDKKKEQLDRIYVKLLNLPIIAKKDFQDITGITKEEDICNKLMDENGTVLYKWDEGEATTFRIDLSMMKRKNDILFTNSSGGVLKDSSVKEIYKKLEAAVSSINFNYRINSDLPRQFVDLPFSQWKFCVQRLTNPTIKKLKRKLETGGISSFLKRETQSAPSPSIMPFERLGPTANIVPPKASDGAQVDFEGLYAEYNWELFYHLPMVIADCFKANAMNEDSMHWFHYIFDPTKPKDDSLVQYYWNFLPFAESENEALEKMLKDPTTIQAYNDSPFDPHAIARLRINSYGKYTIMEYVSNIIQWGDSQFVLNTWESLTAATMMYVWADDLLGPKPQKLGMFKQQSECNFDEIDQFYKGEIPQFIIDLEKKIQALQEEHELLPLNDQVPYNDIQAYFGVPKNEQMLLLWDIIEDRLYKIRNSLDINGAPRTTALFEAPLDPGALARAAAAGGSDMPGVLTKKPVLYPYRFSYMIEQAKALTAQLIQLSNSILSALEKNDAEALLLITNSQEQNVLNMTTSIRESQLQEIVSSIESLQISKAAVEIRRQYYEKNAEEYMSSKEMASFVSSSVSQAFQVIGGSMRFASGIAHLAPQVGSPFAMKYGGMEIGASLGGAAAGYETLAGIAAHVSHQTLTMAQYDRRKDEWELQKKQAEKELDNLDKQLEAAKARQKSAQRELEIHKKTIENKGEVLSYLKKKFSSSQLYQWLTGKLCSTMWQTYQLALELSMSAQEAYEYERDECGNFIRFDYWDNSHKGLMAGECLMLALEQMQQSYHKKNMRRLEIEKNVSMLHIFPEALEALKATGVCKFELGEKLFARDYPGCYRRKITNIALSIPAVLPPYETIKATLKQEQSYILLKAEEKGIDFLFDPTKEIPSADIVKELNRRGEKIAISKGIDDSGVFMLNFNDERYLPFEGTGATSSWTLEMPKENNFFDLNTITDIIITIKYTAVEDEQRGPGSFYEYVSGKLK